MLSNVSGDADAQTSFPLAPGSTDCPCVWGRKEEQGHQMSPSSPSGLLQESLCHEETAVVRSCWSAEASVG